MGKSELDTITNIELHGFGDWTLVVEKAIWNRVPPAGFESPGTNFWNKLVVTTFPSEARNLQKEPSPFVRVFYESLREKGQCSDILYRVPDSVKFFFDARFDVEFVKVDGCISVPLKSVT